MQLMFLFVALSLPTVGPSLPPTHLHENYREQVPETGISFSMIAIRGGSFHQGSPITEPGRRDDEGPRHRVELRPFWIGKYEVTWDEFHAYMREKEHQITSAPLRPALTPRQKAADTVSKPTAPYIDETHGFGTEKYPAFDMSHHAAMKYCEWLSAKTGRIYRLPTEAEWEYACRAGSDSAYPFGESRERLGEYAWFAANSQTPEHLRGATRPVGKLRPNRWGLHDMLGNVAEWCVDAFDPDFYEKIHDHRSRIGPVNLPGKNRYPHVARGGSFRSSADECRSAARVPSHKSWNKMDPEMPQSVWWLVPGHKVGFRVLRPVEEYPRLRGLKSQVTKDSD